MKNQKSPQIMSPNSIKERRLTAIQNQKIEAFTLKH